MASTERRLVAACIHSRAAYDKIKDYINDEAISAYSSLLIKLVGEYYDLDKKRDHVDLQFLVDKLNGTIDNPSKAQVYVQHAQECFSVDISAVNVANLIIEARTKETGSDLAQAIVNTAVDRKNVLEKIDEYRELLTKTSIDDGEPDNELLHNVSIEDINSTVLNKEGLIKLISKKFTEEIDGGAIGGHHVVIFARPEAGKTALVLTAMRSLVKQKLEGIYFGNEDPIRSIVERFQGCLSGMTRMDRLRDPKAATAVLEAQGYGYTRFVSLAPGTVFEIEKYVKEYQPKWIVVDQMRNLATKAENRTNQLESIASALRSLCKKYDLLCLSVTQAGDSASNKLVLDMGDVDSSNTGIPAQADLMVGLGLNKEFEEQGMRMVSMCKNKLSGRHVHFQMKISPLISRLEDLS